MLKIFIFHQILKPYLIDLIHLQSYLISFQHFPLIFLFIALAIQYFI
jgi:hypothetical protein